MADDKKRVDPSESKELEDEALESVAGGCQWGCSNENSCYDTLSIDKGGNLPLVPPTQLID